MRVGDIIKFGRVPFIVKESSIEEGVRGEEFIIKEENETMERNITDMDLDYLNLLHNGNVPELLLSKSSPPIKVSILAE
jgi:hypothetical protein